MANAKLNTLIEGKFYTISFDFNDVYSSKELNIIEIQVLIKLENSIKIKLIQKNEIKWFPSTKLMKFR